MSPMNFNERRSPMSSSRVSQSGNMSVASRTISGAKKFSVDKVDVGKKYDLIKNLKRIEKDDSWYHRALLEDDTEATVRLFKLNKTSNQFQTNNKSPRDMSNMVG